MPSRWRCASRWRICAACTPAPSWASREGGASRAGALEGTLERLAERPGDLLRRLDHLNPPGRGDPAGPESGEMRRSLIAVLRTGRDELLPEAYCGLVEQEGIETGTHV